MYYKVQVSLFVLCSDVSFLPTWLLRAGLLPMLEEVWGHADCGTRPPSSQGPGGAGATVGFAVVGRYAWVTFGRLRRCLLGGVHGRSQWDVVTPGAGWPTGAALGSALWVRFLLSALCLLGYVCLAPRVGVVQVWDWGPLLTDYTLDSAGVLGLGSQSLWCYVFRVGQSPVL